MILNCEFVKPYTHYQVSCIRLRVSESFVYQILALVPSGQSAPRYSYQSLAEKIPNRFQTVFRCRLFTEVVCGKKAVPETSIHFWTCG